MVSRSETYRTQGIEWLPESETGTDRKLAEGEFRNVFNGLQGH
ncbi:MAG: hypothetical protein WBC63_03295 [Candidatus Bipolaricaulia bacterium]